MSCGCGCNGAGNQGPPSWTQTGPEDGAGVGAGGAGQGLQPGRAPGGAGGSWPLWVWIVVALVGFRLLKGGV